MDLRFFFRLGSTIRPLKHGLGLHIVGPTGCSLLGTTFYSEFLKDSKASASAKSLVLPEARLFFIRSLIAGMRTSN